MLELWSELWQRPWRSSLIWPIILINIAGSAYGLYWYRAQLAGTPAHLWLLVVDSPLATAFFALALLLVIAGRRPGLVVAAACATTIKYGLWTVGVITHYWLTGGQFSAIEAMVWIYHLGLVLEGFIFLRKTPLPVYAVVGTAGWMALNDYMDYVRGLHPYLFAPGQEAAALGLAAGLTVLSVILLIHALVCNHLPVN
ncbi:Uncharacterized membrane protein YpjA [Desulfotomaculum arcticum]|uniref:Uncharacterized membrane protein YpjA n=1 Tax=Desulfotruncus arcticus DSM 17038 TaxID=1121424 RepID=A0A1I2TC91_9FIRM|nr:Uncharacterized membrane protein YpjA [Desulfotomaculum arcticum] [Desulfotruncus arcticus DSM 17038]